MARRFVHQERVRFGDLDAMRHLSNVVFLRYATQRAARLPEALRATLQAAAESPGKAENAGV